MMRDQPGRAASAPLPDMPSSLRSSGALANAARPPVAGQRAAAGSQAPATSRAPAAEVAGRLLQFKAGDRVSHGLFGEGIVLKVEPALDDEEVTVAFPGKDTKTLLASFAKLRKVG